MNISAGKVIGDNTVSGIVLAGNKVADQGIVWLISPNNNYNDEKRIDSTGIFHFTQVPAGSYYIYAMLAPGADDFFAYMPTYYSNSLSWQGAALITASEPNAWYQVSLVPSMHWSQGDAIINGIINWNVDNKAEANPVANVEVVLYNSSGDPIAYTFTNSDGTFKFEDLSYGDYTLQAEMNGKASETININLSENSSNVSINFVVNEAAINILGVNDREKTKLLAGNPYPNPVEEILNLRLNSLVSGTVVVEIVDIQGRIIHSENIALSGGNNRISINTGDLSKGIYLLRVNSAGYEPIQRRFIK